MRPLNATPIRLAFTSLRGKWWVRLLTAYLMLLAISHVVRLQHPDPWPSPETLHSIHLPANASGSEATGAVEIRYIDTRPDAPPEVPVVVLVHGSPVAASKAFPQLASEIGAVGRVLAPDLPGFGFSTRKIENYGFVAHANYLQRFLAQLNVKHAHVVAYSMGGGAAIHMAVNQPERVASLALISSIGVQELELLGDYHLNHALHGLQLGALWAVQELIPHMGLLDRLALNTNYARNFYDADQRPLRGLMRDITHPTLILHGEGDNFVPLTAAREHARLLPQSRLQTLEGGHLLVFKQTTDVAKIISNHIQKVENGKGIGRADADTARLLDAQAPFGRLQLPSVSGLQLFVLATLIALATLVSEDLACIGAGMMAARGIMGFIPATAAAFVGIVVGDLMLYGAGRLIGRPALKRAPVKWFITPEDVSRATKWLDDKGPAIIFASRFLPGSRLPVYFTSGVLGSGIWSFLFYFCVAAAVWTPGLVGLSMWAGEAVLGYYATFHQYAIWVALATMLVIWTTLRLCVPLLSFKGRRLFISRYKRIRHWEYWPSWFFYIPIVGYILCLGIRHRHWTLFTAANPAFSAGGPFNDSQSNILTRLSASGKVPPFIRVFRARPVDTQLREIRSFMADCRIDFPVTCKSDRGALGHGVQSVETAEDLRSYLVSARTDTIVQPDVKGKAYSVFHYRYPGQKSGRIFAITELRTLTVTGDGHNTLEHLILKHPRAICQASQYLDDFRSRLHEIPKKGRPVPLSTVSNHGRGSISLDGRGLITPALTQSFDHLSSHLEGVYFGRYDVRIEDPEIFMAGRDFKVIELNGLTWESTHTRYPGNTLRNAWATLMRQWKIAFEIGEANRKRDISTLTVVEFLKLTFTRDMAPRSESRDR